MLTRSPGLRRAPSRDGAAPLSRPVGVVVHLLYFDEGGTRSEQIARDHLKIDACSTRLEARREVLDDPRLFGEYEIKY